MYAPPDHCGNKQQLGEAVIWCESLIGLPTGNKRVGGVEVAWWLCLHLVCSWIKDGGGRVVWGKGQEKGRRSKRAEGELGKRS